MADSARGPQPPCDVLTVWRRFGLRWEAANGHAALGDFYLGVMDALYPLCTTCLFMVEGTGATVFKANWGAPRLSGACAHVPGHCGRPPAWAGCEAPGAAPSGMIASAARQEAARLSACAAALCQIELLCLGAGPPDRFLSGCCWSTPSLLLRQSICACGWRAGDGFVTDQNVINSLGVSDATPFLSVLVSKPYRNQACHHYSLPPRASTAATEAPPHLCGSIMPHMWCLCSAFALPVHAVSEPRRPWVVPAL